jgi:hypothetical protein
VTILQADRCRGSRSNLAPHSPRSIDPIAPGIQNLRIERLEMQAVIEVPQVRQLVAQGVHQARIFERPAGRRMA